jgi:hypothetical protein
MRPDKWERGDLGLRDASQFYSTLWDTGSRRSNGGERGCWCRDDEGEKGEGTRAMRVRRKRGGELGGRAEARRVKENPV